VINQKMLAYAYILLRDKGYPSVFYKDYYDTDSVIKSSS